MISGGGTVLVVDDEPSLRLLCRVNLELAGLTVLEAGTLDEARALLEFAAIDLVLLDVHIAGSDGSGLLDELRAADSDVKVVMLTGSADIGSPRFASADRAIAKPFDPLELVTVVSELVRRTPVDSTK